MIYLDFALRSGAVTLLMLLAALLWHAPIGWVGRLSVLALAISKSAYLIILMALPLELNSGLEASLTLLSSFTPAAITWLIVSVFIDAPGRRWPWITASVATSFALYGRLAFPYSSSYSLPMATALYASLFMLALWSNRDDLVEWRCRARPGFAVAVAGLGLFLTVGQATGVLQQDTVLLALVQSASALAVILAFAVWLLRPDADRWPNDASLASYPLLPTHDEVADPVLIARIRDVMAAGIWREERLTIGALATKLAVPEHRLRRAINQGLGYRNFSNFINHARIKAACAALTDPDKMSVTVLEIAYDVGFASIGPFNRTFRAEIGQSPSEYRQLAQPGVFADSDKSSSFSANLR
ncbi:AraC family transcriptional regulator [Yoonia maricola]|uniref:AraC family transcriptional regulator n=1 Tax=Yoonia maricola TaxID=420999 RepID=A0A2M8W6D0_9RHOB|nr:AraC family transcriptional regulator [Yoonia maricola]PJI86469.1 AraC family transcriptional regulator [Yoonia maricola]